MLLKSGNVVVEQTRYASIRSASYSHVYFLLFSEILVIYKVFTIFKRASISFALGEH